LGSCKDTESRLVNKKGRLILILLRPGYAIINIRAGIKEKIDMEKDLKYFFYKKRFWHSISKQLRSTN